MRDKNSTQAERQRRYRENKKRREVEDLMREEGLSKKDAEEKYDSNMRKKGAKQRRENRAAQKKRPVPVKFKVEYEEKRPGKKPVKVSSKESVKVDNFDLNLRVSKELILDDDIKAWSTLSPALKRLVNAMYITNGYSKPRSLIQYLNKVKSIYKKLDKVFTGNNISYLLNTDNIDNLLEPLSSKKDYYAAIVAVLKAYKRRQKYVKYYTDKMMQGIKETEKAEKDNKKNITQKRAWLKYDDVVKAFKKNRDSLTAKDRLLMTLIIYYPRRLQDYQKMKLYKTGEKDINYNYLNLNKNMEPTTFDFNRSKSQYYEKLGTNQPIPNSVKGAIKEYIRNEKIKNHELLFGDKEGEVIPVDSFSRKVKRLFFLLTEKEITSNLWRHIVATDLTNKKVSLNNREKVANQMGHSLIQSLKYSKHA